MSDPTAELYGDKLVRIQLESIAKCRSNLEKYGPTDPGAPSWLVSIERSEGYLAALARQGYPSTTEA